MTIWRYVQSGNSVELDTPKIVCQRLSHFEEGTRLLRHRIVNFCTHFRRSSIAFVFPPQSRGKLITRFQLPGRQFCLSDNVPRPMIFPGNLLNDLFRQTYLHFQGTTCTRYLCEVRQILSRALDDVATDISHLCKPCHA